jgi:hypothetical protein
MTEGEEGGKVKLPPLEGNGFVTVGVGPGSALGNISAGRNPRRVEMNLGMMLEGWYTISWISLRITGSIISNFHLSKTEMDLGAQPVVSWNQEAAIIRRDSDVYECVVRGM